STFLFPTVSPNDSSSAIRPLAEPPRMDRQLRLTNKGGSFLHSRHHHSKVSHFLATLVRLVATSQCHVQSVIAKLVPPTKHALRTSPPMKRQEHWSPLHPTNCRQPTDPNTKRPRKRHQETQRKSLTQQRSSWKEGENNQPTQRMMSKSIAI